MQGFLITGTDTGVGKTRIACELAKGARAAGLRVGVMKPAETGCREAGGTLEPADARALAAASECPLPLDVICPYRYRSPLAPAVAADEDCLPPPDLSTLVACYKRILERSDVVLVEGAGGIRVPLTWSANYAELARTLNLDVVVVVGNRLGCLNAFLLSTGYLISTGLRIRAVVLNDIDGTETPASQTNESALRRLAPELRLDRVSFGGSLSDELLRALISGES